MGQMASLLREVFCGRRSSNSSLKSERPQNSDLDEPSRSLLPFKPIKLNSRSMMHGKNHYRVRYVQGKCLELDISQFILSRILCKVFNVFHYYHVLVVV